MVIELLEPLETLTIREATWNDFDAIMRVLSIVDHEFVPPLTEGENLRVKVSRILNDRRRSWIKAVDDGRIVGVVAVIYHYRRPQLGLIETLAVLPNFGGSASARNSSNTPCRSSFKTGWRQRS